MIGNRLITHQTDAKGQECNTVRIFAIFIALTRSAHLLTVPGRF